MQPTDPVAGAAGWLAIAPLLVLILSGALAAALRGNLRAQASVTLVAHAIVVGLAALLVQRVLSDGPVVAAVGGWPHAFGITLFADGLAAALALTASIAALAAAVFALDDLTRPSASAAFFPLLSLMLAGAYGVVLTGDLFNLYVWLEIVLVAALAMMAVTGSERPRRDAGQVAVAGLSGSAILLIAIALLYGRVGSLGFAEIAGRIAAADDQRPLPSIVVVLVLALMFKAGAVPFAFRPADAGPRQTAAAAVAVGLSVVTAAYALLRVLVLLVPDTRSLIADGLVWASVAAMMLGSLGALARADLRRIGGHVVLSAVGVALAGIAVGTEFGVAGAILLTVHLTVVATGLWLGAGLVARGGGDAPHEGAGGPLVPALMIMLLLSMAGLPPFAGFWPRVLLAQAALADGRIVLAVAILLAGLVTAIAVLRAYAEAFWSPEAKQPRPGEPGAARPAAAPGSRHLALAPLAAVAALSLLFGLWPAAMVSLVDAATAAAINGAAYAAAISGAAP